jgi:hypothetical protein
MIQFRCLIEMIDDGGPGARPRAIPLWRCYNKKTAVSAVFRGSARAALGAPVWVLGASVLGMSAPSKR